MSEVKWLDQENGIVLWKFTANQNINDIMADFREFAALINTAGRKTYTIVDFLDIRGMPDRALGYFPEMARLLPSGEKRSEVIALVSQRSLVTMLTEIFAKVYPDFRDRFVYFSTVQEALDLIHERIRESAA